MTDDDRPADDADPPAADPPADALDPADDARGPIDLPTLTLQLAELFRPGPVDAWRGRIDALVRRWLARPDARLLWTDDHETAHRAAVQLVLPGRDRPPRHLGLARPLDPEARTIWAVLRNYLATVAGHIELQLGALPSAVPLRWQQLLTDHQITVAVHAAEGLSNEQIAEQLGVAPRTVARLLQEIFRKLGCSNRGELAAERALGRPPTPVHQRVPDEPHPDDPDLRPDPEPQPEPQ